MRKSGFIVGSLAGFLLIGCGGDDSSAKAPSRDELVAEIVESAGVSQEEAECSADALFTSLSEADLAKVLGGGDAQYRGPGRVHRRHLGLPGRRRGDRSP